MNFDIGDTLDILRRTPGVLTYLLGGTSPAWHGRNEGPETWTALDVVGHLVHAEEANWIPRARIILEHGESRPFDPFDRFAQHERFRGWPIDTLLDRFAELRAANLKLIQSWEITEAHLNLQGKHPEFGAVTLRQLLAAWMVHDLTHLAQATRVMAKRYAGDVGPWRRVLSVLGP